MLSSSLGADLRLQCLHQEHCTAGHGIIMLAASLWHQEWSRLLSATVEANVRSKGSYALFAVLKARSKRRHVFSGEQTDQVLGP